MADLGGKGPGPLLLRQEIIETTPIFRNLLAETMAGPRFCEQPPVPEFLDLPVHMHIYIYLVLTGGSPYCTSVTTHFI